MRHEGLAWASCHEVDRWNAGLCSTGGLVSFLQTGD